MNANKENNNEKKIKETRKLDEDLHEKTSEDKKSDVKKEIISWLRSLGIILIISFIFLKVFTNANIPSSSMENTIMTHDRLFGYNFAYNKKNSPKRFDIVIFRMPDDEKEIYIKRVIGIEGDTIDFQKAVDENGNEYMQTLLNGEVLEESYIKEPMTSFDDEYLHFEVPKDCIFVMGDNRNDSYDGRYWEHNYVNKKAVISKAVFRYWPLNKMGVIK